MWDKIDDWEEATSSLHAAPVNETTGKLKRQMIRLVGKAKRQEIRLNRRHRERYEARLVGGPTLSTEPPTRSGAHAPVQPRVRRSAILGFLSPVLSTLFGLPSEGSWKMAQRNLKRLHNTNEALRAALGQTLQIVNVTQRNIVSNRQAIRDLREGLAGARVELNKILKGISDRIEENFQLTTLVEKIQALFHVTASNLRVALHQLSLLKTDLELARQGNLAATLVPVAQFRSILGGIQSSLPRDTYLPAGLDNLVWYYSNLAVHLLMDGQTISLVMDIPLKNLENEYDLYQLIQIPGKIEDPRVRPSVRYFEWDVPRRYIAISHSKEHYVLLTMAEAGLCKQLYCKPSVAFLSFTYTESCILALFKNNTKSVWEQCNTNRYQMPKTPKIRWLFGNTWVAENATGEPYDVICGSILHPTAEILSYKISKTIERIVLPSDCWLRSHLFVTPRMITQSEQAEIKPELDFSNLTFTELNAPAGMRQAPWRIGPGNLAPDRRWMHVDADMERIFDELRIADANNRKFEEGKARGNLSWLEILLIVILGSLLLMVLVGGLYCYCRRCRIMMNSLSLNQTSGYLREPRTRPADVGPTRGTELDVFEPLNSLPEGINMSPRSIKYRPRFPLPSESTVSAIGSSLNLSEIGRNPRRTCKTNQQNVQPGASADARDTSGLARAQSSAAVPIPHGAKRARPERDEFGLPKTAAKTPKVTYSQVGTTPLGEAALASPTGAAPLERQVDPIRISPYYIAMGAEEDYLQPLAVGNKAKV